MGRISLSSVTMTLLSHLHNLKLCACSVHISKCMFYRLKQQCIEEITEDFLLCDSLSRIMEMCLILTSTSEHSPHSEKSNQISKLLQNFQTNGFGGFKNPFVRGTSNLE